LETVQPVSYVLGWSIASTVRPAWVEVPRMMARKTSQVRSGMPAQLPLMKLNRRCSIGFHLLHGFQPASSRYLAMRQTYYISAYDGFILACHT
jgi:hypothetical protein